MVGLQNHGKALERQIPFTLIYGRKIAIPIELGIHTT